MPTYILPKILFVKDNEMSGDMLSRRLERTGCNVVLTVDGASGVELLNGSAVDAFAGDAA